MTREEWNSIKVGRCVFSNKYARRVLSVKNNCITLESIGKTKFGQKTTVYSPNDRSKFSLQIKTVKAL